MRPRDDSSTRADGWVLTRATLEAPRFALAPMEGVSDAVVRDMLSVLGGMDLCVTEFVRVVDRPLKASALRAACPELDRGGRTSAGVPVLVQLLGSNLDALAATAALADALGAPGIDLNFGCPARRVNGHDGGAAILRAPARVERVVRAVRDAVPRARPVSAKIRLGWDHPDDVVDIVRAAEAGGASFITIHGRTKVQMYKPSADWGRIGQAAAAVRVPVIANGDVFTPADARLCRAVTGCAGVMLGRGAFRTPNLFRWIRGLDAHAWPSARSAALVRAFMDRMLAETHRFRTPDRAALARSKQWVRSLAETDANMARCFERFKRCQSLDAARGVLDEDFPPSAEARPIATVVGTSPVRTGL